MKGKTKSGFKYNVNENIRTDWRFVKALADADSEDASKQLSGATRMVNLLLGDEGEAKLEAHVAQDDGVVPIERIMDEVREIITAIGDQLKNS